MVYIILSLNIFALFISQIVIAVSGWHTVKQNYEILTITIKAFGYIQFFKYVNKIAAINKVVTASGLHPGPVKPLL